MTDEMASERNVESTHKKEKYWTIKLEARNISLVEHMPNIDQ